MDITLIMILTPHATITAQERDTGDNMRNYLCFKWSLQNHVPCLFSGSSNCGAFIRRGEGGGEAEKKEKRRGEEEERERRRREREEKEREMGRRRRIKTPTA